MEQLRIKGPGSLSIYHVLGEERMAKQENSKIESEVHLYNRSITK